MNWKGLIWATSWFMGLAMYTHGEGPFRLAGACIVGLTMGLVINKLFPKEDS